MYNSYGTFYHNGYSELYHHGVKGQKHGKRRYQNPDGSLTPEGRIHYGIGKAKTTIKKVASNPFVQGAAVATAGIALREAAKGINKNIAKSNWSKINATAKPYDDAIAKIDAENQELDKIYRSSNDYNTANYAFNKMWNNNDKRNQIYSEGVSAINALRSTLTWTTPLSRSLTIASGAAALAGLGIVAYGAGKTIKNNYDKRKAQKATKKE